MFFLGWYMELLLYSLAQSPPEGPNCFKGIRTWGIRIQHFTYINEDIKRSFYPVLNHINHFFADKFLCFAHCSECNCIPWKQKLRVFVHSWFRVKAIIIEWVWQSFCHWNCKTFTSHKFHLILLSPNTPSIPSHPPHEPSSNVVQNLPRRAKRLSIRIFQNLAAFHKKPHHFIAI